MRHTLGKSMADGLACLFALLVMATNAWAIIPGISGTTFNLVARDGYITTPDGGRIYTWGYAPLGSPMQYPGPTLRLIEGDTITISLTNALPTVAGNVSMIFPGHAVTAAGGIAGELTREAPPDGVTAVTYTFVATHPGTYLYSSGTESGFQTDMGLVGAIVVYPNAPAQQAYNHTDSAYDHEYLFLLTEMDPLIHRKAESLCFTTIDTTAFFPTYWFINGRCAPDTMAPAGVPWLPSQPYDCMPRMRPGEKLLMRMVGGGRDGHPFHHHGNNTWAIARNGRLLSSGPGQGADLAYSDFTHAVYPGETLDAIFEWTGEKLGWDIYGHAPGDAIASNEYAPDHGKPFPVNLPEGAELTFGAMYSGSPFLGTPDALPPGEGGMNMYGGFTYMWHSHNEKEMTNFNIFPGGMMTMGIVEPPGTPIP